MGQFILNPFTGRFDFVATGGFIATPVSVADGGTGNTGHGESSINSVQENHALVDGLVTGTTTIFTPPSDFIITQVIFQVINIVGVPNVSFFAASMGTNNPTYDNIFTSLTDGPSDGINFLNYDNIPTSSTSNGFIPASSPITMNVTSPVHDATVYTFRVYVLGFYF